MMLNSRHDAAERVKSLDSIYFYTHEIKHRRIATMNNSPAASSRMHNQIRASAWGDGPNE